MSQRSKKSFIEIISYEIIIYPDKILQRATWKIFSYFIIFPKVGC